MRVEEHLNALVETPAIDGDGALRAQVRGALSPFAGTGDPVHLLRVGVQGAPVSTDARPDVALVIVVDVPGSMDMQNRLGLVQASLALLTQQLRATDTIAIVAYGSEARTVLEPTPVSDGETIVDAITQLVPDGSTDPSAIATVDLRWLDPSSSEPATAAVPVEAATVTGAFADADDTTRLAALVAAWAEILGERTALADRGIGFDALLAELDRADGDLGQLEGYAELADLALRSASR